jgi:hypothetical protein
LETHFAMRCLDLRMPDAAVGVALAKRVLVTEIVAPRSDKTADEWLYVVGGADKRVENQVFTLLAEGSHGEAQKALAQLKDADAASPVISRAVALLQLPEFRDGGAAKTATPIPETRDASVANSTSPQEQAHEAAHPAAVPAE